VDLGAGTGRLALAAAPHARRVVAVDVSPAMQSLLRRRVADAALSNIERGYTRGDFAEHIRAEFSTFRWLLEPMLTAVGFEIAAADFRGCVYGAYTCVRR